MRERSEAILKTSLLASVRHDVTKKRTVILPRQTSVIPNLPNGSQVYREWQSQKKVSFSFLPAKMLRDKQAVRRCR